MLHPHPEGAYEKLIRELQRIKFSPKVRGDDAVLIGSCRYLDKDQPELGLTGYIYKYLKLDSKEDWINTEKMDVATKEDVAEINIPEHLKPHFKRFLYIFKPKNHRFYFLSHKADHSLSAGLMKRFFDIAAQQPALANFGRLETTVQTAQDGLASLLKIPRIMQLKMEFSPPNPDDLEQLEKEVLERLTRLNVKSQKIVFQEASNAGIQPDENVKALAEIAKDNGFVQVEGKDETGARVTISTKDMPLIETTRYNPKVMSEFDAFYEKVIEINQNLGR